MQYMIQCVLLSVSVCVRNRLRACIIHDLRTWSMVYSGGFPRSKHRLDMVYEPFFIIGKTNPDQDEGHS
jgi:hypothetical protein